MSLVISLYSPEQIAFTLIGAAIASIFAALKYRLDQANYHKDLFNSRYECFLIVEKILKEWMKDLTAGANPQMINDLNSIMRKSYFLFGSQTYLFICKFRLAIVRENDRRRANNMEITDDSRFLENLLTDENLAKEFTELKIDSY